MLKSRLKTKPELQAVFDELDPELTSQAEDLFRQIVAEEGFSEEQAMEIALMRVGKTKGDLDLIGNEDELNEHDATDRM